MRKGDLVIEVRKAGFTNKGAELMLRAVTEKLNLRYPSARLVMAPSLEGGAAPYSKRAKMGFYQKAWLWRYGVEWSRLSFLMPSFFRDMFGLILDREIDVVIDAAGFAYSDQWGPSSSIELAKCARRWKRRGQKLVLLPQAFGPFTGKKIKQAITDIVDCSDLIFARESVSLAYLEEVVGVRANVRLSPDFTCLVKGELPLGYSPLENGVCIIPNARMLDKTDKRSGDLYVPFLVEAVRCAYKKGCKPFILVHDSSSDEILADKLTAAVGRVIPVVKESDPVLIKGIIGSSKAVVGSRFHGLVSALSQGVPALATGWSHKYQKLFDDYEFQRGIVKDLGDLNILDEFFDAVLEEEKYDAISSHLKSVSIAQVAAAELVWDEVFAVIDEAVRSSR